MGSDFVKLPADILAALVKNTEAMEKNNINASSEKESKEKERINNKNIVTEPKVRPTLTSDERKRYALIGKEFLTPLFKKIESSKNKESMLIKNDKNSIQKNLKEQYSTKGKKGLKGILSDVISEWIEIFFQKWMLISMIAAGVFLWLGNQIYSYYNSLNLKEKISGITDWIKEKWKWLADFFNFKKINEGIQKLITNINLSDIWENLKKISQDIFNGFTKIWSTILSKINFDGIWDAISSIPLAIMSPLGSLAKVLLNIFNVKPEEEARAVDAESERNQPDPNIARLENELHRRRSQNRLDDPTTFLNSRSYQEIQKEFFPKIKKEFDSLGISLEKGVLNESGAIDAYRNKVKEEITKQFKSSDSFKLSETVNIKLDDYIKNLNFKNPPSINEIRDNLKDIILNGKQNLTELERRQLDEATLNIATLGDRFNNLPKLYKQLELNEELNENPEKAFALLQENAKREGRLNEFQFIEARNAILNSSEKIVNAFNEFGDKIANNIAKDLQSYFSNLKPEIVLEPKFKGGDDKSTTNYSIVSIDKSDIKILNDKVVELTAKTVKEIEEQNKILTDLATIIKNMPTSNNSPNIIVANSNLTNNTQAIKTGNVARAAQAVKSNAISAVV